MLKITLIILSIFNILVWPYSLVSASMQSDNYKIGVDVLNESGGVSSSTNYQITHNLGESPTGDSSSANYRAHQGFLTTEIPIITFSVSASTVNLGTLTTGLTNADSITLTISTNALGGYNVQAYDDTSVGIAYGLVSGTKKVADATTPNVYIAIPGAGTEHFGLVVTGTHAFSGYAAGTKMNSLDNTTLIDIGSYTSFISDDTLTVQYRASISATTPASASYQSITTYVVTGNF